MTREEKCQYLLDKGWIVDGEGRIFNTKGNQCLNKDKDGYIYITTTKGSKKTILRLRGHHLVFYYYHGYVPEMIDHINRVRDENCIDNLRPTTPKNNRKNSSQYDNAKCYRWREKKKVFVIEKCIGREYYYICSTKDEELAKMIAGFTKEAENVKQIQALKRLFGKKLKNKTI